MAMGRSLVAASLYRLTGQRLSYAAMLLLLLLLAHACASSRRSHMLLMLLVCDFFVFYC